MRAGISELAATRTDRAIPMPWELWRANFIQTATEELARASFGRLVPDPVRGAVAPIQDRAAAWVGRAAGVLRRGAVLVVDYAAPTADLAGRPVEEWVRTYAAPGFEALATRLEALLDRHATDSAAVRDNYRRAMELEYGFFDANV